MPWEEIQKAIDGSPGDHLIAHYQPIMLIEDVGSDKFPTYWEALVRRVKNGTVLSAGDFIPGLQSYPDTMSALDWWMLRTVAGELRKGQKRRIAVNLSAHTLDDNFFPLKLGKEFYGLNPGKRLVLELTERSRLTDTAKAVLRQIGAHCCYVIDDFGEGHSSPVLVADTEPCGIKLGAGLMRDLLDSPKKQTWVRLLAQYAVSQSIYLVAEFVEDEGAIEWLRALKRETPALELWAQGWGVGR